MNIIKFLLITLLLSFNVELYAHVNLKASTPSDNAMLMTPPEELLLTFSSEVMLVKLDLANDNKEAIDIGFSADREVKLHHQWTLPALAPDTYVVRLVFMGKDGHKMTKTISFMVH